MINLNLSQVAWLRVDTQTILTIQNQVITKNYRVSIANTEKKIWQLRIRDVKESDKGWWGVKFKFNFESTNFFLGTCVRWNISSAFTIKL